MHGEDSQRSNVVKKSKTYIGTALLRSDEKKNRLLFSYSAVFCLICSRSGCFNILVECEYVRTIPYVRFHNLLTLSWCTFQFCYCFCSAVYLCASLALTVHTHCYTHTNARRFSAWRCRMKHMRSVRFVYCYRIAYFRRDHFDGSGKTEKTICDGIWNKWKRYLCALKILFFAVKTATTNTAAIRCVWSEFDVRFCICLCICVSHIVL